MSSKDDSKKKRNSCSENERILKHQIEFRRKMNELVEMLTQLHQDLLLHPEELIEFEKGVDEFMSRFRC